MVNLTVRGNILQKVQERNVKMMVENSLMAKRYTRWIISYHQNVFEVKSEKEVQLKLAGRAQVNCQEEQTF